MYLTLQPIVHLEGMKGAWFHHYLLRFSCQSCFFSCSNFILINILVLLRFWLLCAQNFLFFYLPNHLSIHYIYWSNTLCPAMSRSLGSSNWGDRTKPCSTSLLSSVRKRKEMLEKDKERELVNNKIISENEK